MPQATEVQRQKGQDCRLRSKSLGACDSDFWPRSQLNDPVGLASDARSIDVAQGDRRMPLALRFAERCKRVGCFTRLRDRHYQGVSLDRPISVAKLAGILDLDRDPG